MSLTSTIINISLLTIVVAVAMVIYVTLKTEERTHRSPDDLQFCARAHNRS